MTESEFIPFIWEFYKKNKRTFPWRETTDPYAILVSEIMLQQTQTARVIPKYQNWLREFPTVEALATAPLSLVLTLWSGLGYNRRGKFLWESAKLIKGRSFPTTYAELRELPGIGEYTANAVLAFAFNQPAIVIETNIRTVIMHHFFETQGQVTDTEIREVLARVLPQENVRDWYYALMDYGNALKLSGVNNVARRKGYTKQKPFKGSERFVRGYLLRETLRLGSLKLQDIHLPGYSATIITKVAEDLAREGMVSKEGQILRPVSQGGV